MQNYVDAYVARAERETAAAVKVKEKAEAAREDHRAKGVVVAANLLGVVPSSLKQQKWNDDGQFDLVNIEGAMIDVSNTSAWKKHEKAGRPIAEKLREAEQNVFAFERMTSEENLRKFRSFVRARWGNKPAVTAEEAATAYLDSTKSVGKSIVTTYRGRRRRR